MPTITIPKELAQKEGEFVVIPKKDYEEFLSLKRSFPTYYPTKLEIRDMERSKKEIAAGHFTPWSKLRNELGSLRNKKRKKTAVKTTN